MRNIFSHEKNMRKLKIEIGDFVEKSKHTCLECECSSCKMLEDGGKFEVVRKNKDGLIVVLIKRKHITSSRFRQWWYITNCHRID